MYRLFREDLTPAQQDALATCLLRIDGGDRCLDVVREFAATCGTGPVEALPLVREEFDREFGDGAWIKARSPVNESPSPTPEKGSS